MTDKQYPPLPFAYFYFSQAMRDDTPVYTFDQMRAYVDADRAQRLEKWTNQDAARQFHELCMAYRHSLTGGNEYLAIVDWVTQLLEPSRPDATTQGEDK